MKQQILILLFIGVSFTVLAQYNKPHPITAAEEKAEERNHECVHRNKYPVTERSKFYPFNEAKQIKLVFFNNSFFDHLPLKNDTVDYSKISEIVTLNNEQTNRLTDIIYNVGYRAPNGISYEAACYNPHNAILFVDKNGHTFAFFEICFECMGYRLSSKKVNVGEFCTEKYEMMKSYFESVGVKTSAPEPAN